MAKLHYHYSAMNAGKSSHLLQAAFNYQERGMKVALFNFQGDTRFGEGVIASRIGLQMPAVPFNAETEFLEEIYKFEDVDCIFVDEAQFLTKVQVESLTNLVDRYDIPVMAYGLRTDFLLEPFEGSKYLLAWADEINEIPSICTCGRKARAVVRMDDGRAVTSGDQVVIGDSNYVSLCRRCYKEAINE
jgi:thymidine kinase